jgi:hypothetical protein
MASHNDEDFFSHTSGGFVLYSAKEGDTVSGCRFALGRFGEDVNLVLEQFWAEQPAGNFVVVPVFAHGLPPRFPLSTARSIAAALQVIDLEPGSALEARWREVADRLNVSWPKRFQTAA